MLAIIASGAPKAHQRDDKLVATLILTSLYSNTEDSLSSCKTNTSSSLSSFYLE